MDTAPPTRSTSALRRRLYGLGLVDEFGPIYALYTILFLDNGVTTAQISSVFLLWSVIVIVLEVPSGALADLVDRRRLLACAFLFRAAGIAVWLLEPSYAGVIVGASLWSIHSALASGAWESLVHDELTADGDEHSYATVMARITQCSSIGIALGTVVASVAVGAGATIEQLGWLTVAIHAVSIVLVLQLPDVGWVKHSEDHGDHARQVLEDPTADGRPRTEDPSAAIGEIEQDAVEQDAVEEEVGEEVDEPTSFAEWRDTMRTGLRHARRSPVALRLIALGAILEGLFVIDEYVPLMAADRGASTTAIPMFVLVVFAGLIIGDEFAARHPRMSARVIGVALMVGAAVIGVAVVVTPLWPLVLIGVGYATLEVAWLIGDARFQQHLPRRTRATVTSVRSFFSGIVSMVGFAVLTVTSAGGDVPTIGLAVVAAVLFVAGGLATRWIPEPTMAVGAPSRSTG